MKHHNPDNTSSEIKKCDKCDFTSNDDADLHTHVQAEHKKNISYKNIIKLENFRSYLKHSVLIIQEVSNLIDGFQCIKMRNLKNEVTSHRKAASKEDDHTKTHPSKKPTTQEEGLTGR